MPNGDFPDAGQFLVHYDGQFNPGTGSGEVCFSEGKALQYVRDHSTLGEGAVTDLWRQRTGVVNPSVRRVAAYVNAIFFQMGVDIEIRRTHTAQFTYGEPYIIQVPRLGRLPN